MKTKTVLFSMLASLMLMAGVHTPHVSADSLKEIKEEQSVKQAELSRLNGKIGSLLEEVNVLNDHLTELEQEIGSKEEEISDTEKDIEVQQKVVDERVEQAKSRLLSIQTTEMNQNMLLSILEAESVSDLIHRSYVLMTLQGASNQHLDEAAAEQEKLTALQEKLKEDKETLVAKTQEAEKEKSSLDKKVASLQILLKENEQELARLSEKRQAEETRIAEEKRKAQEKAAHARASEQAKSKAAEKVQVASATTEKPAPNKQPAASKPVEKPAKKPAAQAPVSNGRTITVSATGYSTKQAGLSTHTATGIDLRVNPRVIAVDPRVIPLGSMVEIPGFGIYIAGDTGGAIKGNKIDIHFSTVAQAYNWGRRSITIKILN